MRPDYRPLPTEVAEAFVAVWQQSIYLARGVAEKALTEQRQVIIPEHERVAAAEELTSLALKGTASTLSGARPNGSRVAASVLRRGRGVYYYRGNTESCSGAPVFSAHSAASNSNTRERATAVAENAPTLYRGFLCLRLAVGNLYFHFCQRLVSNYPE